MSYPSTTHITTPEAAWAVAGQTCRIEPVSDALRFGNVVAFVGRSVS
jgi:hypothetical protein